MSIEPSRNINLNIVISKHINPTVESFNNINATIEASKDINPDIEGSKNATPSIEMFENDINLPIGKYIHINLPEEMFVDVVERVYEVGDRFFVSRVHRKH